MWKDRLMVVPQDDQMTTRDRSSVDRPGVMRPTKVGGFAIQRLFKNGIDFIGAGILVIVLMPLFVLLSFTVLVDVGRPVIYRRRVVGTKGEFDAFKFRSMKRGAEAILARDPSLKSKFQQNFKLENYPHLTSP